MFLWDGVKYRSQNQPHRGNGRHLCTGRITAVGYCGAVPASLFKFIKAARITTPPSTAPGFPSSGPDAPVKTSELEKYMAGGNNNDAALFGTLFKGVKQQLPDGKELVEMGTGVNEVFRRVLPKWARAFHYLETREILPPDQAIYGRHFTVPDLQQGHGPQGLLQICRPRQVKRGNKDLGAQSDLLVRHRLMENFLRMWWYLDERWAHGYSSTRTARIAMIPPRRQPCCQHCVC
jgi:hypothetical protein